MNNFDVFAFRGKLVVTVISVLLLYSSCESFVEVDPPSAQINNLNVYNTNGTAIAAVTELYGKLAQDYTGNSELSITLLAGLSGDDLFLFGGVTNPALIAHYKNQLISGESGRAGGTIWVGLYQRILSSNASIEGLNYSESLSPIVKKQLLGECYFMRAFCYFYLVGLYGDVPLALTSDPNINNNLSRAPKDKVYAQIVMDLQKARELLNTAYVNKDMVPYAANAERVRPNRSAATFLLSRVYLYMGDNYSADSESMSTEVINETSLYSLMSLNEVFLKNSKEAIWQLQPTRSGRNTDNGFMFLLPANGLNSTGGANGNPVSLNMDLVNSFESGDNRVVLGNWVNKITTPGGITYYYPFKYKVKAVSNVTEYEMVFRLGEQYLIRAEARARQNKLIGANSATTDLNIIRQRAGLLPTTATTRITILDAILKERRSELFSEWGHRWLDLKRMGKVDEVMLTATNNKGGTWRSFQQLYPIPLRDIQLGRNLVQNPEY